ncbi:hypothetical protein B0H17DRAFT_1080245 [Mycena rosella]|uniref:Uncharacterized protein n=1 Tax=Mycena rosella TaxID=1033263 RepID=A0AAD7G807_MYCRO|nr:hypothetical protein B0H17DRAFT_1080245 [Mycena rosella]
MRISISILFAIVVALPTLTAPVPSDNAGKEFALEVRGKKTAAKKPVIVIPAKKAPVPVKKTPVPGKAAPAPAKKAPIPAPKAPVAVKAGPIPAKKAAVAAEPAPVAAQKSTVPALKAPVPAKVPAIPAKKAPVSATKAPATVKVTPVSADKAPVPGKQVSAIPGKQVPETLAKPLPETPAKSVPAIPAKPVQAGSPSSAVPVPASVLGAVANAPSKAVVCKTRPSKKGKGGKSVVVPLADIEEAVRLARTVPAVERPFFPHVFSNFVQSKTGKLEVNVAQVCAGKKLLEHAVGVGMGTFKNSMDGINDPKFNKFRVVITRPDANGATTFCGVMTHGPASTANKFDNELCTPVR